MFKAIKEQKTIEWISVGHDHNNDYHGIYDGINLAYGRKTGFGCYGPKNLKHGARVFEVNQDPYSVKTWIREADGNAFEYPSPHGRSFLRLK